MYDWTPSDDQIKQQVELCQSATIKFNNLISETLDLNGLKVPRKALDEFTIALWQWFTCEDQQILLDRIKNPLLTTEELEKLNKPSAEILLRAELQVSQMREALERLDDLDGPAAEYAKIVMEPQLKLQLNSAEGYLEAIKKAMGQD